MIDIFSDDIRRDPYPLYRQLRAASPVLRVPPPFNAWLIFDYDGVKRALHDHEAFSSAVPAPPHWFLFSDPPVHTKMRALIARAFTPATVSNLEPRIRELSRQLLDQALPAGAMDLAVDYAVPLPMQVIAEMIGIPPADWMTFRRWSDSILKLSYSRGGGAEALVARAEFGVVHAEMNAYLSEMIRLRTQSPANDLLTRLLQAEVDGEKLSQAEILGFFQLLVVGGQETSANLINNAILCFLENPEELARLRKAPELMPGAIEEVLRYRAPIQWLMRTPRRDLEMSGQKIAAGELVLAMVGSANHDPAVFPEPQRFDIGRHPNPHISFGHGIHFCIGAALARMEAKIALGDLLERLKNLRRETLEPWPPRQALHIHGPARLEVRFDACQA
jgi:cytochrome P450